MSVDKLEIIKKYKFNDQVLQGLEKKLDEIKTRPEDTENLPTGEVRVLQTSLLDKIVDICALNVELNLASLKHQLAAHLEHELKDEEFDAKMESRLGAAMKMMGVDESKGDKFGA